MPTALPISVPWGHWPTVIQHQNIVDSLYYLFFHLSFLELYINAVLKFVVFADEWTNFVPDLHIFLFDKLLGSLIYIFEVPSVLGVDFRLKLLPFNGCAFPIHHVLIIHLIASKSYSIIIVFIYVTSETLYLMTHFATMNLIIESVDFVNLVASPSAKGAHLVTSKCLGQHVLIEISNELIVLERIFRWLCRIKLDFKRNLKILDEVLDIRDLLVLNIFLQHSIIWLEEFYPYFTMWY